MRAGDLARPYPTVGLTTPALDAARLLAANDLPGLIVLDERGRPSRVLPGTQVLRLAVPRYVQDDPTLARVVDEAHADAFCGKLAGHTVRELLPTTADGVVRELPVVTADATVLEVAALMARTRSPLVAVVAKPVDKAGGDAGMLGAITLDALLDTMLGTP